MKKFLAYVVFSTAAVAAPAVADGVPAASIFETASEPVPNGRIDELVFARLRTLGIQPARPASDAAFLRRAYFDVIGTLPTAQEASQFLADRSPNKRAALIDRLLERDEFAQYWALKWSDVLRIKAEFPINLWPNAAQSYHRWVLASLRQNKPYDQFARELLVSSGSNFRDPQVNFYRAMQSKTPAGIAQVVALTFMGVRTEKWPADRLAALAAFFTQLAYKETGEWKEEIVFFDPSKPPAKEAPAYPDGTRARLTGDRDPREVFADWLVSPRNPWFARAAANRVWSWFMARGIVQEPDDLRPDNPPVNPELLAYLEKELVDSRFDMKHLFRLILNSQTWQLSSIPRSDRPEAEANFASYPVRRIDAEVLADALSQITGTAEKYSSLIPEPYTVIPDGARSVALPDGSITSPFLELFGRPPRDTGLETERNSRITADQRLHLLNSSHVQRKIEESPKFQYLTRNAKSPQAMVAGLYLMILSRFPTEAEGKVIAQYSPSGGRQRDAFADLAWALINSAEFLYRH